MFVGKPSHVLFEPPLPPPHIVVGITDAQTCLVLSGRLRALREAGFRVTLVSNPGDLLELTSKSEGVESISCPMKRGHRAVCRLYIPDSVGVSVMAAASGFDRIQHS